ncbi:MAG: DUF255 domain-containing protein [Phycisphaerales bacterium]|nr:DUF255 domain-containing protein [Phycisphaerales bacterium]
MAQQDRTTATNDHTKHAHNRPGNRLIGSSSPYLKQHAHNPVDWYPWGEEAIAAARAQDKPIFLSVGYSTCYWCHVMERESFEDDATAADLRQNFISIKLDREERPDLDEMYMAAVQMMTGSGGWPMTVFLEPDTLRPFWGGTYFPPRPAHGRPSFRQVLSGISSAYANDRAGVAAQAKAVAEAVDEKLSAQSRPVLVDVSDVQRACTTLLTILDPIHGGFSSGQRGPKFPQPVYLELLLSVREKAADSATRAAIDAALRLTLDKMAVGGLFDQVGGGFHRYSVDHLWLVPHFEKMLYDQAQLLPIYAQAAKVYSDAFYARVTRRTAEYILREMTRTHGAEAGVFFTAQDAEVNGREGLNYLWSVTELKSVLGEDDGTFAADVYGVSEGANFIDPHHPPKEGEEPRNVLWLRQRPEEIARRFNLTVEAFHQRLDAINAKLLKARDTRTQPRLDDKVITAWNGLLIGGLAKAGELLSEPAWIDAAERAFDVLYARVRDETHGLRRTLHGQIPGVLEDAAMLLHGAIALALAREGSSRTRHLENAKAILMIAEKHFLDRGGDGSRGGGGGGGGVWFDTRAGAADLFVRPRSTYDGAMPSASSVMLGNLVRLYELTGEEDFASKARRTLAGLSAAIKDSPVSTALATAHLVRLLSMDPALVAESLRAQGARRVSAGTDGDIVQAFADVDRLIVTEEVPAASFELKLVIAEGYHLNDASAAEISGGTLAPLRVDVVGGTGLKVYADYPKGQPRAESGSTDDPLARVGVYHGELVFTVAVERTGPVTGEPKLVVLYQACTENACHEPTMIELGVGIDAQ